MSGKNTGAWSLPAWFKLKAILQEQSPRNFMTTLWKQHMVPYYTLPSCTADPKALFDIMASYYAYIHLEQGLRRMTLKKNKTILISVTAVLIEPIWNSGNGLDT